MSDLINKSIKIKEKINVEELHKANINILGPNYPVGAHRREWAKPYTPEKRKSAKKYVSSIQYPDKITLYVHFPFCLHKCSYCYYYSLEKQPRAIVEKYLDAVKMELNMLLENPSFRHATIEYIYFGGGTPTYLTATQLEKLISFLKENLNIDSHAGFTCEVSPQTLIGSEGRKKLKILLKNGVDRLTLGVESFNDDVLQALGRGHNSQQALSSFKNARDCGFENINIDLMFGAPNQTLEEWKHSLNLISNLKPESVDLYVLDLVRPEMCKMFLTKPSIFPDEEKNLIMNIMAVEHLRSLGYRQVDIRLFTLLPVSSWYQSCIYHCKMVGIGPAAVSFINEFRCFNHKDLKKYINSIEQGNLPISYVQKLTKRELMEKEIILKLRSKGLNKNNFKNKFGVEVEEVFGATLCKLEKLGLIKNDKKFVKLTYKGKLFTINIVAQFRYRTPMSKLLSIIQDNKIFKAYLFRLRSVIHNYIAHRIV